MSSEAAVPWEQLLVSDNLQQVLRAIIQRLDRHDGLLARGLSRDAGNADGGGGGDGSAGEQGTPLTVVPQQDLQSLKARLEVLENTTMESKLEQLTTQAPIKAAVAKDKSSFRLADHVIPLTQLKSRVDTCDVGILANSSEIDAVNGRLTALADAVQEQLANMVSKEEFQELETKHNKLQEQVDKLAKDLIERLEKRINEVQKQIDAMVPRIEGNEQGVANNRERIAKALGRMQELEKSLQAMRDDLDAKADKAYVDDVVAELREQIEQINIEEIKELLESTNKRVDLMDERCDKLEDDHLDLRREFARYQQEMQDMQLEQQIENLKRELEEAKSGVFMKATARMDAMQKETDNIRETLTTTQGQVQLNRETMEELEDAIRQINPDAVDTTSNRGTRALIQQLQSDVAKLEQRYADAAAREADGRGRAEETQQLLDDLRLKLDELHQAKADKHVMEMALNVKADKDAVARDTERNLRAVDEALTVMNAGTQGVQQLLEKQEGLVQQLSSQLSNKLDRDEIEKIQKRLENQQLTPEEAREQQEAIFGKYGISLEEAAAGMRRPLEPYACISCNRPLRPGSQPPMPSLPLLPSSKDGQRQAPYIPRRAQSASVQQRSRDGIVEVSELPRSMRSAGGAHTSPRLMQTYKEQRGTPRSVVEVRRDPRRSVELVGEDGRIYHGRIGSPRSRPSSRPTSGK
ncbi:hypothetical protein PTSG_04835 [Salpingoeca rosetta]|uniref:DUF4795 domain-containing protein n=1 Tax=Salpingoeca rosetta (strain ATCC 50818 / BSB-021) TaxID=946362 RepID=F2U9U5_SALR5|nr:uncharacterized protein PTSG_04835 [Salpingoeca rosetta]EGD73122.1 hypothetical protein PTSG_04835 [Salpingoeca rosetta]|eukprot:XP_004994153.1 hypothetical protein PTSG_04835 [Salpingoeca rosetta]